MITSLQHYYITFDMMITKKELICKRFGLFPQEPAKPEPDHAAGGFAVD
jgi:hypothetical protein